MKEYAVLVAQYYVLYHRFFFFFHSLRYLADNDEYGRRKAAVVMLVFAFAGYPQSLIVLRITMIPIILYL
jgi:hypothetical protein